MRYVYGNMKIRCRMCSSRTVPNMSIVEFSDRRSNRLPLFSSRKESISFLLAALVSRFPPLTIFPRRLKLKLNKNNAEFSLLFCGHSIGDFVTQF